ncbi:MAG: thrS, partial [Planctomycetaceae bacterium]|nr:thrS [Planctomycetaceae bacterium]
MIRHSQCGDGGTTIHQRRAAHFVFGCLFHHMQFKRRDMNVQNQSFSEPSCHKQTSEIVAAIVDGRVVDASVANEMDAATNSIQFLTKTDPESRSVLLHSMAHIMGEALQHRFPGTQLVYGPYLEDRCFYDVKFPEGVSISSADFPAVEREMMKIVTEDRKFTRYELPIKEGLEKLRAEKSKYKLDNAQRAIESGSDKLSWYVTGEPGRHFEDLCRGPHVPSTDFIRHFKLLSVAGSHWKGDAKSDRLTRIYGTAFYTQQELEEFLAQAEAAKKRDHRILGKQLNLFHIDDAVGQGLILWKPNGAIVRQCLQDFISGHLRRQGYQQVFTPHIGKLELYKTSGHFPYYQDSQYPPMVDQDHLKRLAEEGCSCSQLTNLMQQGEIGGYLLKPMNCPHHIKIYASEKRSYRDLPIRLAEFGTVYRWEQSGELGGMTRVRGFTQDDAHLFVTEEQLGNEVNKCLELVKIVLGTMGMEDYRIRIGLRDPKSDKYVGDPGNWEKAEQICREAAANLGKPFTEEIGEAAFYGAKIDFVVRDCIGREWQLGTVQIDYNLPERFQLEYIGKDNRVHRPIMIHRAPFGSMERFVGVLIEHFAGAFPLWLAPEQVRVLTVSEIGR